MTPNKTIIERRRMLKSASGERLRVNAMKANASAIYKEIAQQRLKSAKQGAVTSRKSVYRIKD